MACVSIGVCIMSYIWNGICRTQLFQWEERTLNPVLFSEQYSLIKSVMVILSVLINPAVKILGKLSIHRQGSFPTPFTSCVHYLTNIY